MRKYTFERTSDEDLIILTAWANDYEIQIAIDTAATHSVIDFNILLILGYSPQNTTGSILYWSKPQTALCLFKNTDLTSLMRLIKK